MKRVLYVGRQPETMDLTDPALPPGTTVEKIRARMALALQKMVERGWSADFCLTAPDETARVDVEGALAAQSYDCVMIAAGVRRLPLPVFEAVINAVHRGAPQAAIAFNTHPEDTADAVARHLAATETCSYKNEEVE